MTDRRYQILSTAISAVMLLGPVGLKGTAYPAKTPTAISLRSVSEASHDDRLDQRVSYTAKKKRIQSILDDLSTMTGIALQAGLGPNDWQVRDRKMCIFVKDVALSDLMDSIARVMKFKWKCGGDGTTSVYSLYMDRAAILALEMDRQRKAESASAALNHARMSLASAIDYLGTLPQGEATQLKQSNPYLWTLASTGAGGALKQFCGACPDMGASLESGTKWYAKASWLPESAQQALLNALLPSVRRLRHSSTIGVDHPLPDDLAARLDEITLMVNYSTDLGTGVISSIEIEYPNHIAGDGGTPVEWNETVQLRMLDPLTKAARVEGLSYINEWEKGASYDGGIEVRRTWKSDSVAYTEGDLGEPVEKHPDEPDMHRKSVGGDASHKLYSLEGVEEYLAENFDVDVVADAYGRPARAKLDAPSEISMGYLLDRIQSTFGNNWWKHGSLVEVRNRQWFKRRLDQIPEAWVSEWRNTLVSGQYLDIDDLSFMASLSRAKYAENIACDDVLSKVPGLQRILDDDQPPGRFLRFYFALTKTQRAAVFSKKGLDLLRDIRDDQRQAVEDLVGGPVNPWSPLSSDMAATSLRLVGTRNTRGTSQLHYGFFTKVRSKVGTEEKRFAEFITPLYAKD